MSDARWSEDARLGAEVLRELSRPQIGADRWNRGKYAVYFYDADGVEIRSVGLFTSVDEAGNAIPVIQAATVLDRVEQAPADDPEGSDGDAA